MSRAPGRAWGPSPSQQVVLDSSALLCLLNGEAGAARVVVALPSAVIGAVNLAEVVTRLRERGLSLEDVDEALGGLHLDGRPLSPAQACATGHLCPATRALGLSLGDRACLALAAELGAMVLTTDRAWAEVDAGVEVEMIRERQGADGQSAARGRGGSTRSPVRSKTKPASPDPPRRGMA